MHSSGSMKHDAGMLAMKKQAPEDWIPVINAASQPVEEVNTSAGAYYVLSSRDTRVETEFKLPWVHQRPWCKEAQVRYLLSDEESHTYCGNIPEWEDHTFLKDLYRNV